MNCKLFKFYCIFVLVIFFNSHAVAQKDNQEPPGASATLAEEDSGSNDKVDVADTLIIKTAFENANDSIQKWRQGREFNYMAYLDSLLRKEKDLKIDTVSLDKGKANKNKALIHSAITDNSNSFLNSFGVKIFFWIAAFFFVGFILYKLFFAGGLFARSATKIKEEPAPKEPEALNDYSEYNALIHDAESRNNFNLSIRYLYLQSLKKLSDNGLIGFSPDKTNNLYVQELQGRTYQQEFAFLTLNYDYVWYGQFMIDKIQYQELKSKFILFNKKV
jgi:hypothetical protein